MYLSVKNTFPVDLETLRNKKNPVALKTEKNNEHRSRNLAKNPNVPSSQEDHITQVSEEIEGRVTTKLSQKSSRTENRILGALARLGDFLMNPLIQGHSGTPPKTSRNAFSTSQGTNEDDSQSDPHPEAGIFRKQTTQNFDPADGHDMVTGNTEEIRNRHDMVTGVLEETTYCSPSISSEKQKRTTLTVNRNSAVRIPVRRSMQTKLCGPFSSWQTTTSLQISLTKLTEIPNCQSHTAHARREIWKTQAVWRSFPNEPQNP